MRTNRVLVAKGWYWVSTGINNREGVFRLSREVRTVLHDARKVYEFEVCGLRIEADRVSFCIKAVNELAAILLNRGQPPQKNDPILKKLKKKPLFLRFFRAGLKQNAYPIALSTVEKTISLKI